MATIAVRMTLTCVFFLIFILSLIGSILFLVTYNHRRKLRKPHIYILVSMCIVDIVAVCVWTLMTTISVISNAWLLSYGACVLQSCVMTFCNINNFHSFVLLGVERTIKIWKPSKHDDIFTHVITIVMIGSVWFIDLIMAIFPAIGWGKVRYYEIQYQCIPEFQLSTSHMNFLLIITYVIPLIVLVILYTMCFIKIQNARRKVGQDNGIVLEVYKGDNSDSYSYRVNKMNSKFKNAGTKSNKPKLAPRRFTAQGYSSDSDSDFDSDSVKQQIYLLSRTDYELLKTLVIITCVYVIYWLPYVILYYMWTYSRYTFIPDWLIVTTVVMTHFGNVSKPLIYIVFNINFRSALKKTLFRRRM